MMTGDDVSWIRLELSRALGRHISRADLALAVGISAPNANRDCRRWETDGPTGPAAVALWLMHELVVRRGEVGYFDIAKWDFEQARAEQPSRHR